MNKELKLAYEILKKIYIDKSFSSIQLNKSLNENSQVSNALVTKIVYGVLENDILLEHYVSSFLTKKPKTSIMILLKIGAYVNKFLTSIPPFALVNELVNIAKKMDKSLAAFLNATLKNVINGEITYPSQKDSVKFLSVKYSYPMWLVKKLLQTFDFNFVEQLISHELTTLTHIRINENKTTSKKFEEFLNENNITYEKSMLENAFFVNYEQLLKHAEISTHYISMGLTSMNFCQTINAKNNSKIFDACASPGGKSLYLSQINPTVSIVAGELHEHRVELIKKLISKYDAKNIKPILNDATVLNENFVNQFDVVVCDVPCSGIGVVGKKPDILLNRKESDIVELVKLQQDILQTSSNYVKVNGELFYSTCTILREENQGVIEAFLKNNPNFELEKVNSPNNIPTVLENEMVTYLPNVSNTEGFFIARLVKKS